MLHYEIQFHLVLYPACSHLLTCSQWRVSRIEFIVLFIYLLLNSQHCCSRQIFPIPYKAMALLFEQHLAAQSQQQALPQG